MKAIKSIVAILLVLVLALGLFGCDLFQPDEKTEQIATTSFEVAQADPAAYFTKIANGIRTSVGYILEVKYSMDDIEIENELLKSASGTLKKYITSYLSGKLSMDFSETKQIEASQDGKELVFTEAQCPVLFRTLSAADAVELTVQELLELKVAEKLAELEVDIEENRNIVMKGKSAAEKRAYVLEQMGEVSQDDYNTLYQIDGKLNPAAEANLLPAADKADILVQLAKANDYLVISDYTLVPKEFTVFAQVLKDGDRAKEINLTVKYDLTATGKGAGNFADQGEFPISMTLTKEVKIKDIDWFKIET